IINQREASEWYFKRRLQLMQYMLDTTPDNYRKNDALFQLGQIYWERGTEFMTKPDLDEAMKIWSGIGLGQDKDFLAKDTVKQLKEIIKMAVPNPRVKQGLIQRTLNQHLMRDLEEKNVREKRLLWKK